MAHRVMTFRVSGFVLALLLITAKTYAADADPHAEDRKQLLHLMSEVETGINEQHIDRMPAQVDDNATVTWLNAEVSRGKADIKAYYQRMVGGEHVSQQSEKKVGK